VPISTDHKNREVRMKSGGCISRENNFAWAVKKKKGFQVLSHKRTRDEKIAPGGKGAWGKVVQGTVTGGLINTLGAGRKKREDDENQKKKKE